MSKYDSIENAADLVSEVSRNGLSTEQDDINRAQDIFGRSTIEELAALANNDGTRIGEDGNKWSTGKRGTQDAFYFIAFSIWNWRDATAFYNEHTNPATKEAKETAAKLAEETKRNESALAEYYRLAEDGLANYKMYTENCTSEYNKRVAVETALKAAQQEILTLKAKLYDLMAAGA